MSFLVRKLNKRTQLNLLCDFECINDIFADVPTSEFRTNKGTLSTWIIDSYDKLEDAVLAIAVSSTKITKMDFIIMNTELLDKNGLEYKQTYAGVDIPVPDIQDTHYDITDVSVKRLINCSNVYKTVYLNENAEEEKYIKRFTEKEIKVILRNAILQNRVDISKASKEIRIVIEELSVA